MPRLRRGSCSSPRAVPGPSSRPGLVHASVEPAQRYAVGSHRVDVAAGGEVRFERTAQNDVAIALTTGRVTCEVAPLAAQGSFRVLTRDGEVRVVGTRFVVDVRDDCTWVSVLKGRVWLRGTADATGHERELEAGQEGSLCTPVAVASTPTDDDGRAWVHEAIALISEGKAPARAAELLTRYLDQHPGGLFEEEALFYLCISKKNLGELDEARRLADRFRVAFPQSRRAAELNALLGGRPSTGDRP